MLERNETGRSMVEMLGVLAVIGVLSVGGVAGYTKAMNKHRANEILNEASKRAVLVAGQLLTNPDATTLSLSQFGTNPVAGATFDTTASIADGKITLTVSGVETAICNQMRTATGTNSVMQINTDCTTLTFNSNMSKGEGSSSGPTVETDVTDLEECTIAHSGYDGWNEYTGDGTNQILKSGDRCLCHYDYPVWNGTACVAASTTKVCNSSTSCGTGEYCRYVGASGLSCYSNASGYPVTGSGSSTEVNGTCEKVAGVKKTTGGEFYYSTNYMDWFSAKSWCEALGKDLVSYSTLNAAPYECSKDDKTCNGGDFSPFRDIGLTDNYWTAELYNSCHAWYVYVDAIFRYYRRHNVINYALCE